MQVLGKNGVFVNNAFFEKDAMIPLINGTEIRIGEVAFSFLLPRTEGDDEAQGMDPSADAETGLQDGVQGTFNERMQDVNGVMAIDPTFDSNFPDMEAVAKSIGLTTEQPPTSQPHTSAHDHSVAAAAQYTASAANNKDAKPPFTYASLIAQAVNTAPDRKVTLNGIYDYIQGNYPYYANLPEWQSVQNSIRHNLSLNKAFIKVPRMDNEPGKGAFWTIDPAYDNQFENGVYKKSRRSTVKKGSSFASGGHSDGHHSSSNANGKSSVSTQANGAQKPTNTSSTAASIETNPHLPFSLGPQGQLLLNPVLLRHLSSLTLDQLQQLQSMQAAEAIKWLEKHLEPEGGLVAALAKAMAAAAAETQPTVPISADGKSTLKKDDAASTAVASQPKLPSPPLSATQGDEASHPTKRIKTQDAAPHDASLRKIDHTSEVSSDGTPDINEKPVIPINQPKTDVGQSAGRTASMNAAPVQDTSQASAPQEDEDEELVVDVLGDDDTHPSTLPLVQPVPDIDVNGDDDVQAELEKRVGSGGKGRGGKGKGKSIPPAGTGKGKGKSVPGRASGGKKMPSESLLPTTLSGIGGRPIRPIVTTRKRKMAAEEDEDGYVDIDGD